MHTAGFFKSNIHFFYTESVECNDSKDNTFLLHSNRIQIYGDRARDSRYFIKENQCLPPLPPDPPVPPPPVLPPLPPGFTGLPPPTPPGGGGGGAWLPGSAEK